MKLHGSVELEVEAPGRGDGPIFCGCVHACKLRGGVFGVGFLVGGALVVLSSASGFNCLMIIFLSSSVSPIWDQGAIGFAFGGALLLLLLLLLSDLVLIHGSVDC